MQQGPPCATRWQHALAGVAPVTCLWSRPRVDRFGSRTAQRAPHSAANLHSGAQSAAVSGIKRMAHVRMHTRGRSMMSSEFPDAPFSNRPAFDWFDHWYPVGFIKDFDQGKPHRFVLLGIPLVIWHQPAMTAQDSNDASSTVEHGSGPSAPDATSSSSSSSSEGGSWRVFADVCPHRLVPLSEGRITEGGHLECPYHGWAFNGRGGCVAIPQEGRLATPRACATAYPCVVRQGLLFVKPKALPKQPVAQDTYAHSNKAPRKRSSSSSSSGIPSLHPNSSRSQSSGVDAAAAAVADGYAHAPVVPEFDDPSWLVQDTWRDVPYDWSSLLENVLDASHVPFTHHKSISNRQTVGAYDMHLTQQVSGSGFRGHWQTGPRAGALGPQETWFRPPCYMQHKIDATQRGYESMVVVYAVPIAPGTCRLLNRNAFRFTGGGLGSALAQLAMRAAPGWAIHLGTQVPLEDDQIFLHLGEAEFVAAKAKGKSAAQAYYMPSPADTYVIAFRSWIRQHGNGGPFGDVGRPGYKLEPRLTTTQLLDRYSQHTAHCAQCQAALKRVQAVRQVLGWATAVSSGLALLTAAAAVATVAAAAAQGGAAAAGPAAAAAGGSTSQAAAVLVAAGNALAAVLLPVGAAGEVPADALGGVAAAAGLRLAAWLVAALVAWLLHGQLAGLEQAFYTGRYPPPRNTDRK